MTLPAGWLAPNFDGIPSALRDHARWLLWNLSADEKKQPNAAARPGVPIDGTNPVNWSRYDEVVRACQSGKASGIGLALGKNGNGIHFSGIDLDKCRDPHTGIIEPWALDVLRLINSYTEISPSGTGIKIFVTGSLPEGASQDKRFKLEIYDRARYFTVTGHHLPGTPTTVEAREPELRELHSLAWSNDLVKWVHLFGLHLRTEGDWVYIPCPWAHKHTTPNGEKDAALHLKDGVVNGFECFHAHCKSKHLPDVLAYFNLDQRSAHQQQIHEVRLTFANTITPRLVLWLWDGRLALGSFGLLAGREGIGKTTCAYDIAAKLTRGRLPGVHFGQPRTVIVAATEDSWEHTIIPRLMAAGADLSRVARVDVVKSDGIETEVVLPRDIPALAPLVEQEKAALILLDPLISRLTSKLDTHKDADVRQALEPLVRLANATKAAVLGIIHVNKGSSRDPLNMVMGSRAFTAVARAVLFVSESPDDEDTRMLGQGKNNPGRADLPTLTFTIEDTLVATTAEGDIHTGKLTWTGESDRSIRDVVEEAAAGGNRTATNDAVKWLESYLQHYNGIAESKAIKQDGKKEGHSDSTLKRACKKLRLRVESNKGFPRSTYWLLPDKTLDLCVLSEAGIAEPAGRETQVDVGAPNANTSTDGALAPAVLEYLRDHTDATITDIRAAVKGNSKTLLETLDALHVSGKVTVEPIPGKSFGSIYRLSQVGDL